MTDILLYRGDSTHIDEFLFSKTNKTCLLGKGFYLTDSGEVGHSYRTKNQRPAKRNGKYVPLHLTPCRLLFPKNPERRSILM